MMHTNDPREEALMLAAGMHPDSAIIERSDFVGKYDYADLMIELYLSINK